MSRRPAAKSNRDFLRPICESLAQRGFRETDIPQNLDIK